MMFWRSITKCLLVIIALNLGALGSTSAGVRQSSLAELQNKLQAQYAAIEEEIARPPSSGFRNFEDYKVALRSWQDQLASRFSDAAATVEQIAKIDLANTEMWNERLETLRLYSQPISPPDQRRVFGSSEVQRQAKIIEAPAAIYTEAARAEKVNGDVRIRLVLAADGSVKNVFPIKSLSHGLTESAMAAARQITFQPALRKSEPASQFATFVYNFKKGNAKPFIPPTVF